MAEAKARRDRDRCEQMRGIEQADIELVAHIRPRHFPDQLDIEAFRFRKSLVHRDDERSRVGEGNEPDPQFALAHLSISEAVMIDCAMSTIFFFSRIAVERISE